MAFVDRLRSMVQQRRSRLFWFAFFVFCALLLVYVVEWFLVEATTGNWEQVRERRTEAVIREVNSDFNAYQREAHAVAQRIAKLPGVVEAISQPEVVESRRILFESLRSSDLRLEMSAEVYDKSGNLLAWVGRSSGLRRLAVPVTKDTSFILQGAVYSYLALVLPLEHANKNVVGYIAVYRLFDVNYPLSNRFISSAAFTGTFSSRLGRPITFSYSVNTNNRWADGSIEIPLQGVSGGTIGYVRVDGPTQSVLVAEIERTVGAWRAVLAAMLSLLIATGFWLRVRRIHVPTMQLVAGTLLLWGVRYVWVFVGFPSAIFTGGILDPQHFASPFGYGIARSIGELLITSIFLCANIWLIMHRVSGQLLEPYHAAPPTRWGTRTAYTGLLFIVAALFYGIHRGFGATLRSAVFDSTLGFKDPSAVLPSFEVAAMLLNLGLISIAVVLGSLLLLGAAYRLAGRIVGRPSHRTAIMTLVFVAAAIVAGLVQDHPLSSHVGRVVMFAGLFTVGAIIFRWNSRVDHTSRLRGLRGGRESGLVVLAAVLLMIPQFDSYIHERDRSDVELYALDLTRPIDTWLTFVLQQALIEMASPEAVEMIAAAEERQARRAIAFTKWARSILSREGYNCDIVYVDSDGREVSRFNVGLRRGAQIEGVDLESLKFTAQERPQIVAWEETGIFGKRVIYSGIAPLFSEEGEFSGGVAVAISAGERAYFRGEAPPILRTHARAEVDRYPSRLVISEYADGRLIYTTGDEITRYQVLREEFRQKLFQHRTAWREERIGGKAYSTFYTISEKPNGDITILGVARENPDWRWHLFDFLRLILFYLMVSGAAAGLALGFRSLRGSSWRPSFRTKLVLSFFVVSLVPVILIASYNSELTLERANESLIDRLSSETSIVRARVIRNLVEDAPHSPVVADIITDEWCEEIALDLGTDFSIYVDGREKGTSKPELYRAEILDRRLSGEAFHQVVLEGRGFFVENEMIGNFAYLVGYRPLETPDDGFVGVLAVPILYKQMEILEELARRNALLFGAYAIAVLLALIVGTVFANQIASPIRQLIGATRRIAQGDLSFRLPVSRKDEIGELHQAFNTMTEDLENNRAALLKAEREMAWKEMAKQVAHEIKNPLTPIQLSIQHLRQAYRDRDVRFDALLDQVTSTITDQIHALSRIASEFARFARMPERKDEIVDLHATLRDAARLFEEHRNVQIHLDLAPETLTVRGDREELRRVFINIIRNSVQAMNEHGSIEIQTRSSDGMMQLRFADTGPGIPEHVKPRLFEPNFSTKTEGMGLGLAIVKKTIDDLHGTIEITSVVGKGTVVLITLPSHTITTE